LKRILIVCILATAFCASLLAQNDVLGTHNLSLSTKGGLDACLFCHAPHSGVAGTSAGLWSQKLSTEQSYTLYTNQSSKTMANADTQPLLGGASNLCLSCHDGTVAPGDTVPYGQFNLTTTLPDSDNFGTDLQRSHPFSLQLPLADSPDLVSSIYSNGTTADPLKQVQLVKGNVECTSCHNPHVQFIDKLSQNFLVRDGADSQICLSCHEANARTVGSKTNPLAGWSASIHAQTDNAISNTNLGSYATVAHDGCLSCHMPHKSGAEARLLRGPVPPPVDTDAATQSCMTCHNGSGNISPAIPNIYSEFSKKGHPFPQGTNVHDAAESTLLNNNRHATCVDCHNPHASQQTANFTAAPEVRLSETSVPGISGDDGTTVLNPAVNQYEICYRCHGSSGGKPTTSPLGYLPTWASSVAGDPFDVRQQFSTSAVSSHPVQHKSSGTVEPSLLPNMLMLDGQTPGRSLAVGTQTFCTDCHNSDDDREFGGKGPSGPHGSQYDHIFERRYEFSQVGAGGPGTAIQNLFIAPSTSADCSTYPCVSPYALCAKCHDLNNVLSDAPGSFKYHNEHVSADGFSCSVCHTGHGVPYAGTVSGKRLVNFDLNVVAPYNGVISYDPTTQTCVLSCHNHNHT